MVVEQLIKGGSVRRGVLGARLTEVRQDERGERAGTTARAGLRVDEVVAGSVAERVGLRRGDLIVQVNDVPVVDLTTFAALSARPGMARLGVVRDGERMEVGVEFGADETAP